MTPFSQDDASGSRMHIVREEDTGLPDFQAYGLGLVGHIPDKAGDLAIYARYNENKAITHLTVYHDGKPHEAHTAVLMQEFDAVRNEDLFFGWMRGRRFRNRSQEEANKAQLQAALRRKAKRPYHYGQ